MGKREEESGRVLVHWNEGTAIGMRELLLAEMRRGTVLGTVSENQFWTFVILGRVDI